MFMDMNRGRYITNTLRVEYISGYHAIVKLPRNPVCLDLSASFMLHAESSFKVACVVSRNYKLVHMCMDICYR